ncbi:MAG: thiamine-phosphate kinase [Burkholderiaceae bacterium]
MGEFDLIRRFFSRPVRHAALGGGDDCALLQPAPGMQLAISSDMLVEGRHFLSTVPPASLGHKALAVNLSDLAACGARPLAFTLALALPRAEEAWLEPFSQGLYALADAHGCELLGGDTTRGPLNICITVFGEVPAGGALLRSGARPGDDIWLSGAPGEARLALEAFRATVSLPEATFARCRARMEQPQPRVALGLALRGVANAAVDVSDGFLGDLGHILQASRVGAAIALETARELARRLAPEAPGLPPDLLLECVLAGGDDYELAFTAAPSAREAVMAASNASHTPVTRIGQVEAQAGLRLLDGRGQLVASPWGSFDHFA